MSRPCVHRVPHSATCSLDWEECDNCGKGDEMSITDELREYTKHYSVAGSKKDTMLSAIADRIDAEHERLMQEQPFTIDMVPMTDERMAEHGWVRLPVDADGEYIHIGDVMETEGGKRFEVRFLTLTEIEWTANSEGWFTEKLRHHHAPTVEDVLEELLREYDRDDSELTNGEIIERFAAKLKLAGDAE